MNESLDLEMASITPYGVEIDSELLCWLCSAETIQEMTNDEAIETRVSWVDPVGYPDGFTCARCADVFMPLPENELASNQIAYETGDE